MNYKTPILLTGCARSGTSMTAGIIHLCGAWGGKLQGSSKYNQRGMFENMPLRQDITKPFLRSINCDPMAQYPLPSKEQLQQIYSSQGIVWREAVLKSFRRQGLKEEQSWFVKDPKMCLIWPIWDYAFPAAKWILIRRKKEDIARSCLQTGFMRAYDTREGWLKWVETHEQRFQEMILSGMEIYEVWPEKIIDGDLSEIETVVKAVGLRWDESATRAFIAPSLWKQGKR